MGSCSYEPKCRPKKPEKRARIFLSSRSVFWASASSWGRIMKNYIYVFQYFYLQPTYQIPHPHPLYQPISLQILPCLHTIMQSCTHNGPTLEPTDIPPAATLTSHSNLPKITSFILTYGFGSQNWGNRSSTLTVPPGTSPSEMVQTPTLHYT